MRKRGGRNENVDKDCEEKLLVLIEGNHRMFTMHMKQDCDTTFCYITKKCFGY